MMPEISSVADRRSGSAVFYLCPDSLPHDRSHPCGHLALFLFDHLGEQRIKRPVLFRGESLLASDEKHLCASLLQCLHRPLRA